MKLQIQHNNIFKKIIYYDDYVKLPDNVIIPYKVDIQSLEKLIKIIFSMINQYPKNVESMINRAILTPKNYDVDKISNLLIEQFSGPSRKYYSFDETL